VVGRLAGDEFLVFVPFAVLTDALPFAERLRSSISTSHVTIGELSISRSASIGVTRIGKMVNAEHAVIDANAALRSAKSAGKNQASAFEGKKESLGQATPSIDDVRLGLRRGEIGYYVQPILDLLSMHAIGFEALLRWTRPNGEVLGPGYFLNQMTLAYNHETKPPLAEAHRTAEWAVHSQGKFIAFNISSAFLKRVAEKGSGWINEIVGDVPHDHIVFELVETIVDGEDSEIARVVANLRGNGVRIALDDFGSGHSTLHRLQSIPVDYVKIDRHFLAAASRSDRDLEIMRGMISIIHASGSEAIVEGIETQSQLDLCRQLGASFGQGFFLGQPAPLWSWGS